MSSRAQKRANKQNAQHSTGPRTDEGKQRCSQNAVKHGLRSKHPVIPGEDPAEYQSKLDKLRNDLRPVNALEDEIVEQIADASWRLKRLSRIEAAVNSYHLDRCANKEHNAGKDEEHILGDTFTGYALTDLQRLSRYESQLSRRFHRLTKELRDLRKDRDKTFFVENRYEQRQQHQPTQTNGVDQPSIDIAEKVKRNEQTQSVQAILESITSDDSPTLKRPPTSAPITDFHRVNPNKEAVK
jgi:hypothetical protein